MSHDPLRDEPRRSLRMFLFWGVIPWWRVPPEERPLMWRVFWWRFAIWLFFVAALVLITVLLGPMTAVQRYIMQLAGPEAEQNPGPYLLLSAVLTVLGPIAVVAVIWHVVRHRRPRRRW